ncbi:hypothetical protein GKZ75_08440 [Kocuria indica]|uniref:Uncharacterized protein n=1 Tax=Kocuria marina subsp. indica TaxID=1049583 RepID=A0A6N9R107_9MICC|nr:hypothetical protein [Kocuria indica]NDO78250.1 hypothetical protein [Kocuria indica]
MSPIIANPTGLDAMQAARLAQRHYELRGAYRHTRNPDVADAMLTMQTRREDHQTRTGWVADYDGENTVYHYTDPDTREGIES